MYRCIECKTVYKEKIDYCDCGNNLFEEIPDQDLSTSKSDLDDYETVPKRPILPIDYVSYTIFFICCAFSLCYLLFLGPEPAKKVKNDKNAENQTQMEIPNIDKIWDDSPAYVVNYSISSDLELYKAGVKNALMSYLDMTSFDGAGSCDIEFVIDSHGNLKKKKLYQNTANKPLIRATKKMLSALKKYNPPPKAYSGEPFVLELVGSGENYQLQYKN